MRGKGRTTRPAPARARITPAYAGKRKRMVQSSSPPQDHPRMCGKKPKVMNLVLVRPGSPPHVRGKELRTAFKPCRLGITPACAGKSGKGSHRTDRGQDHPRMCGEKMGKPRCCLTLAGSPPHVRGKAGGRRSAHRRTRITPACAGKRGLRSASDSACRDHPRMCGEKTKKIP